MLSISFQTAHQPPNPKAIFQQTSTDTSRIKLTATHLQLHELAGSYLSTPPVTRSTGDDTTEPNKKQATQAEKSPSPNIHPLPKAFRRAKPDKPALHYLAEPRCLSPLIHQLCPNSQTLHRSATTPAHQTSY